MESTIRLSQQPRIKNDEMQISSIKTQQQLLAFLQGAEGKVLLRSSCCELWVPLSLIMPNGSTGSTTLIGYLSTNGKSTYQFNPGLKIIGVSVDGQVYYPTSTFPAQQYNYDLNTGILDFVLSPQIGLNMSYMYII